ncbi:MAG: ParA family protein [Boseongicola sp. SB0677_bin_26]|nr:ParA family protein [Boseongicola sp. SB0665_bin_10]MYG25494.1 ParA family protein [Boseongicola sp. SB0677_bin_26]
MYVIAMISQKGGSGKTTLALHLAVAAQVGSLNTAIIDLDPQASAAGWGDRRTAGPVVISTHAKRLSPELRRVRDAGADLLVIDTAPHADASALEAARVADLVVVPCRPSILDVETAQTTLDLVATTGTPAIVVLNATPAWGGDAAQAEMALRGAGMEVMEVRMNHRLAFSRALLSGQTALETDPAGKAADETKGLARILLGRLHRLQEEKAT